MVTTDKSRFNRRRMYLISNEFTLPAFSGAWPLLIAEGFISLKRDLCELNIVEIPVEPRVRSNLIPGRARAGGPRLPSLPLFPPSPPPSFRIIRNNSSYLSSVSARYRTCMYTIAPRMGPPKKWATELDDFRIFSSPTNYLFRAPRSWQTVVTRTALRENTSKKVCPKRGVDSGGGVCDRWHTKCGWNSDGLLPCGYPIDRSDRILLFDWWINHLLCY